MCQNNTFEQFYNDSQNRQRETLKMAYVSHVLNTLSAEVMNIFNSNKEITLGQMKVEIIGKIENQIADIKGILNTD